MSAESFKRKLTAILSADVKGYSRLMGENEAETVKTLTAYRKIMGELIQRAQWTSHRLAGGQHPGRVWRRRRCREVRRQDSRDSEGEER